MRRVITDTFDAYFHLWHNGTPNWEKEKRAWELEQEKEWTKVLSKSAKRALKKTEPPLKRVRFAEKLVQSPKKVVPSSSFDLTFGSHVVQVDPSQINAHPTGAPHTPIFRSPQRVLHFSDEHPRGNFSGERDSRDRTFTVPRLSRARFGDTSNLN